MKLKLRGTKIDDDVHTCLICKVAKPLSEFDYIITLESREKCHYLACRPCRSDALGVPIAVEMVQF